MAGNELFDLIRVSETLVLKPYLCPAGYPTQGYGRRVPSLNLPPITKAQAEAWLLLDVRKHEDAAKKLAPNLVGRRLDALTDLVFNVGNGALDGDNVLDPADDAGVVQALRREDWKDAAARFRRWNKARDPKTGALRPLAGLIKRREVGARWIEEG
jgi:lysozyme